MTKARSNATANAAKGDLTVGNGTNLSGVLAVGSNGDTIVADSSTSTGLRYQGNFAAGKNKIINGDFGIWQRGTSFVVGNGTTYSCDRYKTYRDGSGATVTISRETFTPGTAPVAGYEGTYFLRFNQSVAGTGGTYSALAQSIEDVRTFAGQTVTFSFWAKANANRTFNMSVQQEFGSGGSSAVYPGPSSAAVTTSWQRFSFTYNIPSVAGKTIGTGSYLQMYFDMPLNTTFTFDTWGWQVEAGSVATAFQTATGTIQGELAACQRYFYKVENPFVATVNQSTSSTTGILPFPVVMRVAPTATYSSAGTFYVGGNSSGTASSVSTNTAKTFQLPIDFGRSGLTAWNSSFVSNNGTSTIEMSSEL